MLLLARLLLLLLLLPKLQQEPLLSLKFSLEIALQSVVTNN